MELYSQFWHVNSVCAKFIPKLLTTDHLLSGCAAFCCGLTPLTCFCFFFYSYGKSVSNQRIEALWSQLRPHVQSWKEFFKGLIDSNQLEPGHEIHMACARFSFASLIQHTLNNFTTYWNQHHIRKSSECPAGKPDELFFLGESVSMSIAPDMLQAAREEIQYSETITGDSDIDNYFSYVCETRGYLQPSTKSQGLNLYCNLIEAQSDS